MVHSETKTQDSTNPRSDEDPGREIAQEASDQAPPDRVMDQSVIIPSASMPTTTVRNVELPQAMLLDDIDRLASQLQQQVASSGCGATGPFRMSGRKRGLHCCSPSHLDGLFSSSSGSLGGFENRQASIADILDEALVIAQELAEALGGDDCQETDDVCIEDNRCSQ